MPRGRGACSELGRRIGQDIHPFSTCLPGRKKIFTTDDTDIHGFFRTRSRCRQPLSDSYRRGKGKKIYKEATEHGPQTWPERKAVATVPDGPLLCGVSQPICARCALLCYRVSRFSCALLGERHLLTACRVPPAHCSACGTCWRDLKCFFLVSWLPHKKCFLGFPLCSLCRCGEK